MFEEDFDTSEEDFGMSEEDYDNFLDSIKAENGMATKKQLKELLTFIGGFKKWPLLNEDCRREVIKNLDYKSRYNLGRCSKFDYDIVEKTPIHVQRVEIRDTENAHHCISEENFDNVNVRIVLLSGEHINLFFSQIEQDTRIKWICPKQSLVIREVIWKSCNYYEEAVKFAEKWMKKSNFDMNAIEVKMVNYPFETSQIKSLPCCKELTIWTDDMDTCDWWLRKVPEQLDRVQLLTYSESRKTLTLPSNFLNAPQIMQASHLYFWCQAVFSDEQLLKLKARSMYFESADVTGEGINQFIKNWVNGKGVNRFKEFNLWFSTVRDPNVIMAGLDEVMEWDEEFENEEWEFVENFKQCFEFGRYYQIKSKVDPFESITLNIHEDFVAIYATGKRVEDDGEVSTCYQVPELS